MSLVVEPPLGLLADRGLRRRIVLAGGVCFAAGLVALAFAPSFAALLVALALLYPASGAFVSLSQATLMDSDASGRERNMARWTLAGSVGVATGPLLVAAGAPWRIVFAAYAGFALVLVALARHVPFDGSADGTSVREALRALRSPTVVRWVLLLEVQDLGGDILYGYLAIYFVDAVGADARTAALAVAVWTGADLLGNVVVLRVLSRVGGLRWLRLTALGVALVFPAFQLAPGLVPKVALAGLISALNAGWYPISQARLYEALPGRSGTALAVSTSAGLLGALLPLALGLLAARVGIHDAFWLVLVAPIALLLGTPRR